MKTGGPSVASGGIQRNVEKSAMLRAQVVVFLLVEAPRLAPVEQCLQTSARSNPTFSASGTTAVVALSYSR